MIFHNCYLPGWVRPRYRYLLLHNMTEHSSEVAVITLFRGLETPTKCFRVSPFNKPEVTLMRKTWLCEGKSSLSPCLLRMVYILLRM